MRCLISGGGTGGHIYPALTIAKTLSSQCDNLDILFVGTKHGLESDIVPKEGFKLETIEVYGFERKLTLSNVKNVFTTFLSVWQARKIIKKYGPDIVVGTGGYVCGPVLLAASLMGIPTIIQEQNVIPGITNRILARFVNVIAVGYEEARKYFSHQEKIVFTGNPVRPEVLKTNKLDSYKSLGLDPHKKTILVSGGSRGARSINVAMLDVYKHFAAKEVQILHVTGQSEYNNIVGMLTENGIDVSKYGNIIIKPYLYNMQEGLAVADIAIFRAGAIGLAELTAKGIPSILIPYPYAAENHQEYNARVLEQKGAAVVIKDCELDGDKLCGTLELLFNDEHKLCEMADAAKKLGRPNAAEKIAEIILDIIK